MRFPSGHDLHAEERALLARASRSMKPSSFETLPLVAPQGEANSRHDHDLADDLAVLNQPQSLPRRFERQHLVDHRTYLVLRDELHQRLQVLVIEAVGADDLELEAPDIAQILLRVVAGGRAADEQLAAAFETAQRRVPRVPAGEIDHHVDA